MRAILPVLDEGRNEPYYMQLYGYLKNAIASGEIGEGERLPSLRSLAKSTGLSITTIEKAYDQLLVEGYVYSKAQSGFYAGKVTPARIVPYENSLFDEKLSESLSDAPASHAGGGALINNALTSEAIPGHSGDSAAAAAPHRLYDPDCFDFKKWKKCMNRVLNEESPALFFEGSPQGEAALSNIAGCSRW